MIGELRPVRAALNTNGARFPTQAKKRLIATHAKLEISPTQTKQSTSHFLIATKNTFSRSQIFCPEGAAARNSHLCRAGFQPRHKPAPEYFSTACADSLAQSPPCAVDVRTRLPSSPVTDHSFALSVANGPVPSDFPWPPWRPTATVAKLEIKSTPSKHRTSRFSNRNKNSLSRFQTFSAFLGVSAVNVTLRAYARIEFQS